VELSARIEYALLALLELASSSQKEPLKISEITAKQAIPDRYLEQILTSLRRHGIVQSQRGAKGGYSLTREPWQITLWDIVESVEGDGSRREQGRSVPTTLEKDLVCELGQQAREASQAVLNRYTLQDLSQRRQMHQQTSPMYHI
jgi:Rrf2 family protein